MTRKNLIDGNRQNMTNFKALTVTNIAWKLLFIFRNHIGKDKAISRAEIFRKVFGRSEQTSLSDEFRWDFVRKAMHLCRKKTKCFICSMYSNGIWKFFVISNHKEAEIYSQNLERAIRNMRSMQLKAKKSIEQRWYRIDWTTEDRLQ